MKPVAEPYPNLVLTWHMNMNGHEDQSSPDSGVQDGHYNTHIAPDKDANYTYMDTAVTVLFSFSYTNRSRRRGYNW